MSCGCNSNTPISSWIDWAHQSPQDPLDLLADARIMDSMSNNDTGVYLNSSTFSTPPSSWSASPFAYSGEPIVISLRSDQQGTVAEGLQWNFSHLTRNSDPNLAIPLQKVIFMKAGTDWEMHIPITLGGDSYPDIQLGFRDNAGTRGDMQGTVPVISFTARPYTGDITLAVSLKQAGRISMVMRAISNTSAWSMFERVHFKFPRERQEEVV